MLSVLIRFRCPGSSLVDAGLCPDQRAAAIAIIVRVVSWQRSGCARALPNYTLRKERNIAVRSLGGQGSRSCWVDTRRGRLYAGFRINNIFNRGHGKTEVVG